MIYDKNIKILLSNLFQPVTAFADRSLPGLNRMVRPEVGNLGRKGFKRCLKDMWKAHQGNTPVVVRQSLTRSDNLVDT